MGLFAKAVIAIYLFSGLIAFVAFRYPSSGPNLDHPIHWRRQLNRVLGYAYCNLLSCLVSPALLGALSKLYLWLGGPTLSIRGTALSGVFLMAGPVPLALVFFHLLVRYQRWSRRQRMKGLRKSGLLPPIAPASGTPVPVSYRGDGFDALDLHDDEIVRELARGHWQAINHAAASNGDVDAAHEAQSRFLDEHLPRLDAALALHVRDVYIDASVEPSRELARIAALKNEQALDLLERRKRYLRKSVILIITLAILSLISRLMR